MTRKEYFVTVRYRQKKFNVLMIVEEVISVYENDLNVVVQDFYLILVLDHQYYL